MLGEVASQHIFNNEPVNGPCYASHTSYFLRHQPYLEKCFLPCHGEPLKVDSKKETVWAETCTMVALWNITKVCLIGTLDSKPFKIYNGFSKLTY